jgi:hypothetical protein
MHRSSVKFAKHNAIALAHNERIARGIAFESGYRIEIENGSASLVKDHERELLCSEPKYQLFWRSCLDAMCNTFPHLALRS